MDVKWNKGNAFLLLFLAAGLLAGELLYRGLFADVPDVTEFYWKGGSGSFLSADTLDSFRRNSAAAVAACRFEVSAAVAKSGNGADVTVVYTDNDYGRVYPMRMLSGSFHLTKTPSAVIGENLAARLFHSAKAVGVPLTVGGKTYTVSGVYAENDGFISELSKGRDQIFVLRTDDGRELQAVGFRSAKSPGHALADLNVAMRAQISGYEGISLQEEKNLAAIPRAVLWFVFAAAAALLLLAFAVRRFRRAADIYRGALKKEYPLGAAFVFRKQILRQLIPGLLAVFLILLCVCLPKWPGLPADLIPVRGIFDFDFYRRAIIRRAQSGNDVPFPMYYPRYIQKAGILLLLYDACFLVSSVCLAAKPWRRLFRFRPETEQTRGAAI